MEKKRTSSLTAGRFDRSQAVRNLTTWIPTISDMSVAQSLAHLEACSLSIHAGLKGECVELNM